MPSTPSQFQTLIELAKARSLIRAKEIREAGIRGSTLSRAVRDGTLERVNRGIYRRPDAPWDEYLPLSEVVARIPHAVIVLVSALNFHQIGTHQAHRVWIQLKNNAVKPSIQYPPIEVVRTGDPRAFTEGVETHELNGIAVRITSATRTVADCFKHRNKLGLELCLEALREVIRSGAKPSELLTFARMNRVERVMLPYLEALA